MSDVVAYILILGLLIAPTFAMILLGDAIMRGVFALQSLVLGVPFG